MTRLTSHDFEKTGAPNVFIIKGRTFYKHEVHEHNRKPYNTGAPDYDYYAICPHCQKESIVKHLVLSSGVCDCGKGLFTTGTILYIEDFPFGNCQCSQS